MGFSTERDTTSSIFVFSKEQSKDTSLSVCFCKEEIAKMKFINSTQKCLYSLPRRHILAGMETVCPAAKQLCKKLAFLGGRKGGGEKREREQNRRKEKKIMEGRAVERRAGPRG